MVITESEVYRNPYQRSKKWYTKTLFTWTSRTQKYKTIIFCISVDSWDEVHMIHEMRYTWFTRWGTHDSRDKLHMIHEMRYTRFVRWGTHDSWDEVQMTQEISYTWFMRWGTHDSWDEVHTIHEMRYRWFTRWGTHDSWDEVHMIRWGTHDSWDEVHMIQEMRYTWFMRWGTHDSWDEVPTSRVSAPPTMLSPSPVRPFSISMVVSRPGMTGHVLGSVDSSSLPSAGLGSVEDSPENTTYKQHWQQLSRRICFYPLNTTMHMNPEWVS